MGALELRVEIVGSRLTCVLRVQLGPSGRTECLNCLVPSPAPFGVVFKKKKKTIYHSCLVFFFLFCFNIYSSGCLFPKVSKGNGVFTHGYSRENQS